MLGSVPALAQGGFLDIYYVPKAEIEFSDPSSTFTLSDGTGFGLRGRAQLDGGVFLQGEYQANEYDRIESGGGSATFNSEASMLRAGAGLAAGDSPLYGLVEFIKQELEFTDGCGVFTPCRFDDSGFGLHLGLQSGSDGSHFYGQVGFIDVGDFGNGIEFLVGGVISLNPTTGLFADYRRTTEEDGGVEAEFSDLRVGLRAGFGG